MINNMGTYYSGNIDGIEIDYGRGHLDCITIRFPLNDTIDIFDEDVDKFIKIIEELKIERERIKKIDSEYD